MPSADEIHPIFRDRREGDALPSSVSGPASQLRRLCRHRLGSDRFGPGHLTKQHDPGAMSRGKMFVPHADPETAGRITFENRVPPTLEPAAESNDAQNTLVAIGIPLDLDTKGNL
ncbi:MAG TPA: hypothetical protein VMV72_05945 [Verrucomicrobiae bacterium]|nr:hypothetical protein [Verrucomicrobiae bacterium]